MPSSFASSRNCARSVARIDLAHVDEVRPAEQRRSAGEIEVIAEHHPCAGRMRGIERARGVGQHEPLDAQPAMNQHVRGDLLGARPS